MGLGDILNAGKAGAAAAAKALNGNDSKEPDLTLVKSLVRQYSEAWWAEKDAKQKKDKLRKQILELHKSNGVELLDGDEGAIKIYKKSDSIGIIMKAAKEMLTEEQIQKCTGVTRKGGLTVEFTPAKKRPDEE